MNIYFMLSIDYLHFYIHNILVHNIFCRFFYIFLQHNLFLFLFTWYQNMYVFFFFFSLGDARDFIMEKLRNKNVSNNVGSMMERTINKM
jgi:hypothetical protein